MTKILIVDDSALMRTLVRSTVEVHGRGRTFQIVEAQDGEEAFAIASSGDVGLVLLDWNMPRLDGIGLVRRLRAQGSDVPIVMVTAISHDQAVHEAVRAGVSDYVLKPFKTLDLWERIAGYVR